MFIWTHYADDLTANEIRGLGREAMTFEADTSIFGRAQEIAGAAKAYQVALVLLLFDRGISGKIAGQEIRSLRHALPQEVPLIVSGRAVNLLAKPIEHTHAAADFGLIIARMRAEGVLPGGAGARAEELPEETERA